MKHTLRYALSTARALFNLSKTDVDETRAGRELLAKNMLADVAHIKMLKRRLKKLDAKSKKSVIVNKRRSMLVQIRHEEKQLERSIHMAAQIIKRTKRPRPLNTWVKRKNRKKAPYNAFKYTKMMALAALVLGQLAISPPASYNSAELYARQVALIFVSIFFSTQFPRLIKTISSLRKHRVYSPSYESSISGYVRPCHLRTFRRDSTGSAHV